MRKIRLLVVAAVIASAAALNMAPSALATHGCPGRDGCTPIAVTVVEGLGTVCGAAGAVARNCVHDLNDPIWNRVTNNPPADGLFWPGVGPAGKGPFSFSAGGLNPPNGVCVSTAGGPGCISNTTGELYRGMALSVAGDGAYCGSSHGIGLGTFTAGDGSANYTYNFRWEQSAATILPLTGQITSGPDQGAMLVGFTSSRGVTGTGNCGITQATTGFQVEGMTVTF